MATPINWDTPTTAHIAAMKMARKRPSPLLPSPEMLAQFICMADESLWYTQAKKWSEDPPTAISGPSRVIWKGACRLIVEIVDKGFDGVMWWNVSDWSKKEALAKTILLSDFGVSLKHYHDRSRTIIGPGFWVFLDIMCGVGWRQRYDETDITGPQMLNLLAPLFGLAPPYPKEQQTTIFPCINPYCTTADGQPAQVDVKKRRSGACCKACVNYECTHPSCKAKARDQGWSKYTHRWGTKIADEHIEWRRIDE